MRRYIPKVLIMNLINAVLKHNTPHSSFMLVCAYTLRTVHSMTFQNDHFQINNCIDRAGHVTVQKGMDEGTQPRMNIFNTVLFGNCATSISALRARVI